MFTRRRLFGLFAGALLGRKVATAAEIDARVRKGMALARIASARKATIRVDVMLPEYARYFPKEALQLQEKMNAIHSGQIELISERDFRIPFRKLTFESGMLTGDE